MEYAMWMWEGGSCDLQVAHEFGTSLSVHLAIPLLKGPTTVKNKITENQAV